MSERTRGRPAAHRGAVKIAILAALQLSGVARAHHGRLYDETDMLELEGDVVAVRWVNPHVHNELAVAEQNGSTVDWRLEGTSLNALERFGLTAADVPVGARVQVRGPRSRAGANSMIAAVVRVDGGEPILLWPDIAAHLALADSGVAGLFPPPQPRAGAPEPSGLFRIWTPRERSAAEPASLPLTETARRRLAAYDPLVDDPALRCVPPGMPAMLDTLYPIEFIDRGDRVIMRFEEWGAERTIYVDPGRGPAVQDPSPYGVSFGRWENQRTTLAVFTLYIDYPYLDARGTPLSGAATVLERYTPSADGRGLDWETTVTDPTMFSTPIVRQGRMAWEPGEVIKPFECALAEDDA